MNASSLKIGLTEAHGMAMEQCRFPPSNVSYTFMEYSSRTHPFLRSPMKGYMCSFYDQDFDAVEAILNPAWTRKPWFYSLAMYQEALAFNVLGVPIPRKIRAKLMEYLFLKDNFKKFLFWSEAGLETMKGYGQVKSQKLLDKAEVVYPAIQSVPDELINFNRDATTLLFNGNFFIKGGVNVVDAFEALQKEFPKIKLRLCCDEKIDFHTGNPELRKEYLRRIAENDSIEMGRVDRETFLNKILPETDIYVLPTYGDAFGFAILEAMAYGISVVSTNYMAIPEMISHGHNGYLVDISSYNCLKMFPGCYVQSLPKDFSDYITTHLTGYLRSLLISDEVRKGFSEKSIEVCRNKFSFERRNEKMNSIYKECL